MLVVTGITIYSVRYDERYTALIKTLDIPRPTAARYIFYSTYNSSYNERVLKGCISKGDGTPAQLEGLYCTDNMEKYRQSVPAFKYNAAVFPPYGDTKHHWYIRTYDPYEYVSLITNSKEEILNYINNNGGYIQTFIIVPPPDTLQ